MDIFLTQSDANALMAMEKHRVDDEFIAFPTPGDALSIPLVSADKRDNFLLDIYRGRIGLKINYQERTRQTILLVQLHIGGRPHRNPDNEELPCPHLHVYREGFGVKWAIHAPVEEFPDPGDIQSSLFDFMNFCNITIQPRIQRGLFA